MPSSYEYPVTINIYEKLITKDEKENRNRENEKIF